MSVETDFVSVLSNLDQIDHKQLYVSNERVQVWNKNGFFSKIEKLVRELFGQFEVNTVARQIDRESRYMGLVIDNPLILRNLMTLSETYSDHAIASSLVKTAAMDVFRPVHSRESLRKIFDEQKSGWKKKFGAQFNFDFGQINYVVYLSGHEKERMSTHEIIGEFDRLAAKANYFINEFDSMEKEIFFLQVKYKTSASFSEIRKEFESQYLPSILSGKNKNGQFIREWVIGRLKEKSFSTLVDQMLSGFQKAYRMNPVSEKVRLDLIQKYLKLYKSGTPLDDVRIQLKTELLEKMYPSASRSSPSGKKA